MPKVLIVSGSAYSLGGMERVMQRLGRGLVRHGYETEVIVPSGHIVHEFQRWFESHGTSATASDQLAAVAHGKFRALLPLVKFLRTRKADLINLHSPGHHIPILEVLAAKLAGAAVVTSIHGFDGSGSQNGLEKVRNLVLGSRLNRKVVAPSQLVRRQQLEMQISPSKLELIYCGVEAPQTMPNRADIRRRLNIPQDAFVIVSFGRLVPDKGIDILIAAVNTLSGDSRSRLTVFIGGLGDLRTEYEGLVRGSDHNVVHFLGHVTDTGVYYAAADLFVLPSRHEPFGLVFVEAAQYGVPSIGTRVGGIPEAIEEGETGLLVPPGDPEQLRDAIELLIRDTALRSRLGAAAERRARRLFREDTMVAAYAALYNSVLAAGRAPGPALE